MTLKSFTALMGWVFLILGILGFIPNFSTIPHVSDPSLTVNAAHGRLLGLFPVNALHNLIHLGFGIWGLTASTDILASRIFCRSNCIVYTAMALMGLFPGLNTFFGIVPLHGHDVWLHAAIAALTGYYGYVATPSGRRVEA
jgi:hypothetical protein